jgi:preprotein translocase subunit YajC
MVGMLVVFYFFIIRPQQKKQKDQKKYIAEVKKGDDIITIGGIHGKIFEVGEETIILEVEKGGKMKMEKSSISLEASKKVAK